MDQKLKYIAYCRKSSEDIGRQVLTIESQLRELKEYAEKHKLHVIEYLHEEKSAHKRGRLIFGDMMRRIENGKANAILVWIPSRVARNASDGGWVVTLMDEGALKEVRTTNRVYQNTADDKFFLALEFGIAKKSSDDLKSHVKTGHYTKVLKGWRNGPAPLGYLNTKLAVKGENTVINDPDRLELVERILRMFLEGHYSVRQIQKETEKWGLKTRLTKRQGGKYLTISHIYRILTEPFYAGHFWANNPTAGERVFSKGAHEPMITLEEFDRIQIKLGRKGKPRPHGSFFQPFNGKAECGECGSMITTDIKYQMICTVCKPQSKFAYRNKDACPRCNTKIEVMVNPSIVEYTYHTCTRRKNPKCKQGSITSKELISMVDQALVGFKLSDDFTQWALEELKNDNVKEVKNQNAVIESQQDRYRKVVTQLQNLALLYTSPENIDGKLLSIEEYTPQRTTLLAEKKALEEAQQHVGRKVEEWVDWAENSFNFATAARVWFEEGTPAQKRDIFFSLSGSNLILKDRKLNVSLRKPLDLYAAIAVQYPSTTIALEHANGEANKRDYLPFEADIPSLRRG